MVANLRAYHYLEQRIIDNLQTFLLELGKGFAFIGRQYPLTINNVHYYVDLVFYHRILKCFVLIDLKKNSVKHEDIGQMNMYMGYFAIEKIGKQHFRQQKIKIECVCKVN